MDLQLYNEIVSTILLYGHVGSDASLRAAFVGPLFTWKHHAPEAGSPFDRARLLVDFLAGKETAASEPALAIYLEHCAGLLHEDDAGRSKLIGLARALRQLVTDGLLSVPPEARYQTELDAALALLQQLPTDHVPDPTPVPPNSRLPFPEDPNFTGRQDELRRLASALKESIPTVVAGLGGMGKSSLANAFAHRYGQYFPGGVFWLSFADRTAVDIEIAACGRLLALRPDYDDLDLREQVSLTRRAWQEPVPHLLIFDNCEDESLLDDYRPTVGGSRVLVTSRDAAWEPARAINVVHLRTLVRADSVSLLRKLAPRLTGDEAHLIAEALGDFPLAIYLAGSFLARYQSATPSDYAEELRNRNPLEHPSLQGRGGDYSPTRHERDVHNTFLISFDRLDTTDPIDVLAADLLRRAACFAPGEPIPHDLLLAPLAAATTEERPDFYLDTEDALERLRSLGLVEHVADDAVRLHRLLAAFVMQLGIELHVRMSVESSIVLKAGQIDKNALSNENAVILPHLRYATKTVATRAEDSHSALLSFWLGSLLPDQGDYTAALPFLERALAIREQVLGPDHLETAHALNNLANLLHTLGDYAAARLFFERALAIRERALGPDHLDTAQSLNNLASLLHTQGVYAAARPLHERALAIREQLLDPGHPT
jgi:tetratricopeptide (TPR) repeat protein